MNDALNLAEAIVGPCDGVTRICEDLAISPQFTNLGIGLKLISAYSDKTPLT